MRRAYGSRHLHLRCSPPALEAGQYIIAPRHSGRQQLRTCSPLPLGNIGPPFLPVFGSLAILLEASLLLRKILVAVEDNHGGPESGSNWSDHGTSIGWRMEQQKSQQQGKQSIGLAQDVKKKRSK